MLILSLWYCLIGLLADLGLLFVANPSVWIMIP